MFYVFHLDVAMTIQVYFNSILHMLQRSDGCCRGDGTLGQGKGRGGGRGRDRDGVVARGGARRGGGRNAVGLTPGPQPGWGLSRGWSDAVTRAGSDASTGTSDAKLLQASELRPNAGLGPDVWALVIPYQ